WRERRLPSNVDPFDAKLDDPLERARLRKVFKQGLDKVVGHALPLRKNLVRWESGAWFLRAERCYLFPGDSPMGLRLPLDSIPWAAPGDRPNMTVADPTQHFPPLPAYRHPQVQQKVSFPESRRPEPFESAASITRTAMCAEPRNGVL